MSVATTPEPVYLRHMPRSVAKRVDEIYATIEKGSLTIHKGDDGQVKYEIRAFVGHDDT